MDKNGLFSKAFKAIDRRKDEVIKIGETIYKNPETGFKEFKTSELVAHKFAELSIDYIETSNIPGVKATIDTGKDGPGFAIIGELDSVICPEHPDSDPETGAAHACGHNIQISAMLGAAMAISDSELAKELSGKIHFIAVPAEEYIEVEYRLGLREKGIIKYLGGKPEFLYRGLFDDVDISLMLHSAALKDKTFSLKRTSNGCVVKKIRYLGKPSHAGGAPYKGINALYAAELGMMAINCIRETFREKDYIRVHPIITKGGDAVNIIPSDVHMETYVRGKSMDAILKASKKVDNALLGGAISIGAQVEITDVPGYYPINNDSNFLDLTFEVMKELADENQVNFRTHGTGSTDMGDLSALMPIVHPYVGGVSGGGHSSDFKITDPDTAYITGAKLLSGIAISLLSNNAVKASDIINEFNPVFKTKEDYFEYTDRIFNKRLLP